MWRITVISNSIVMFIFWGISLAVISPAQNRFVMYPKSGTSMALPGLSAIVFSIGPLLVILPLTWTVLAIGMYWLVKKKPIEIRNEYLLSFSTVTLATGGAIMLLFLLAGILPFMLIGMPIN